MLYVSTSCLKNKYNDLNNLLEIYETLGIKNVELGVWTQYLDIDKIERILSRYNFNYIVHHYFPPAKEPFVLNLASSNPQILNKSLNQIINSIMFCREMGIDLLSFHAGFRTDPDLNFNFFFRNISDYNTSYAIFKKSLEKITAIAGKLEIRVAVENNVLPKFLYVNKINPLLMCEAWEFIKLFEDIGSENLGILLDVGHLNVTATTLEFSRDDFIRTISSNIFALHLHENNGLIDEHRCPSRGSWAYNIGKKYIQKKKIPVVLECKVDNENTLLRTIQLLK